MRPIIYNLNSIRPPITGIGRYAIELISAGQHMSVPIHAYVGGQLLENSLLREALLELDNVTHTSNRNLKAIVGKLPYSRDLYRWRQKREFQNALSKLDATKTILHDINYSSAHADITTIYDLSHITCPETHPRHRVAFLNRYFSQLEASNCKILTISNQVRLELIEHYNINPDRITVTHLAADKAFKPRTEEDCQLVLQKAKLSYKKFILCLGTREPRKNISSVLKAYAHLSSDLRQEYPLVIAGPSGWKNRELDQSVDRLRQNGELIDLGFVQQNDLPILYSAAAVFAFPSIYEGFGLPLLEAMQSGCPCLTSASGALAEVSGTSSILINPLDVAQIKEELANLLENADLRSALSIKALRRASDFTWSKTAAMTFETYASL